MPVIPDVPARGELTAETYQPGSAEDFDRLYRTAYPRVYRTLTAILADPGAAEDCAQDAFVQAFGAWKRWRASAMRSCGTRARGPWGGGRGQVSTAVERASELAPRPGKKCGVPGQALLLRAAQRGMAPIACNRDGARMDMGLPRRIPVHRKRYA